MIVYFSGTGNTEWVASRLSTLLCDKDVLRATEITASQLRGIRQLGICFPVHGWGIPSVVERIISLLTPESPIPYLYMVCTCGDDIGETASFFQQQVETRGQQARAFFSVQMPNTYVNLPGFDVDPEELQRSKVRKAEERLNDIAQKILRQEEIFDVVKGNFPWIKSHVIRPFFLQMLMKDSLFRVTYACIGCGHCVKVCPTGNIRMEDLHPVWLHKSECPTCMACYHSCQVHAIAFSVFTKNKGQYLFKKLKF